MLKKLIMLIFVLGFLFVNLNFVSAATWYVSNTNPSCNDAGPGTLAIPLCNISAANTRHAGGDTVYIMPGEYREMLFPKGGTPSQYTVYSGYGDRNQVVLLGSENVTGWTQCNPAIDPCTSTNVWYANFYPEQTREEEYTQDLSLLGRSSYCFVFGSNFNCMMNTTDCWEYTGNTVNWYLRPDLVSQYFDASIGVPNITSPGQYYYDQIPGRIYIYPFNSDNPNTHTIECSSRRVAAWSSWDPYPPGFDYNFDYFTIQNLTIRHSLSDGVAFSGGQTYISVINNDIGWVSGDGTVGQNPAGVFRGHSDPQPGLKVINNTIHDTGSDMGPALSNSQGHSGDGIVLYGTDGALIEGNEFYNIGGFPIKRLNSNVTFRNNIIHNSKEFTFMTIAWDLNGLLIEGNIIYYGTLTGYGYADFFVGDNVRNAKIRHNTVYNRAGIGLFARGGNLTDIEFKNNIIYNETTDQIEYWDVGTILDSDYNLFYNPSSPLLFRYLGTNYNTLASWVSGSGGLDSNSLNLNPQFLSTNPSSPDFLRPAPNSPAIDNGTWIQGYHCTSPGPNSSGCREWYGSAPDIGAYEYNPGIPIVTCAQADVNDDLIINIIDLALVIYNQGQSLTGRGHLDINTDGFITFNDVSEVRNRLGQRC